MDGPPIKNGIVTCFNGQIVSVGTSTDTSNVADLGDVVLLPGLVNCHTHLEFSSFIAPLRRESMHPELTFPAWIENIVEARRFAQHENGSSPAEIIREGLSECHSTGSAVVGEIATRPWADYAIIREPVPYIIYFYELLGSSSENSRNIFQAALNAVQEFSLPGKVGLSPHAPYTTHPAVLEDVVNLSAARGVPLAMHLAESREELELLRNHSGPFVEVLEKLKAWNPGALIFNRPLGYLQQLARGSRALIIHGNYLDDDEIAFISERRRQLSVVYCPRTHAYFGHDRYPLRKLLKAGVRVAVGTDSRASNPDLSLFEELRYLALTFPEVNPETILRMGTMSGAEALGVSDGYGRIKKGYPARFALADITTTTNDPYEALWTSAHTRCS